MWYGVDTNTTSWPPNTSGTRFYIGELGIHGTKTTANFNTSIAAEISNGIGGFVDGYWFLGSKPSDYVSTDFAWGANMAQLAMQQAKSYPNYQIGRIWADVEQSPYWTGTTYENYQTVCGFCWELSVQSYGCGIYSAPSQWNPVCGNYSASAYVDAGWTSEPQVSSPPTSMANAQTFSDLPHSAIILWQYVASNSADYDAFID